MKRFTTIALITLGLGLVGCSHFGHKCGCNKTECSQKRECDKKEKNCHGKDKKECPVNKDKKAEETKS